MVIFPQRDEPAHRQGLVFVAVLQLPYTTTAILRVEREAEELFKLVKHDKQFVCLSVQHVVDQTEKVMQRDVNEKRGPGTNESRSDRSFDRLHRVFRCAHIQGKPTALKKAWGKACLKERCLPSAAFSMKHGPSMVYHLVEQGLNGGTTPEEDRRIFDPERIQKLIRKGDSWLSK